MCCNFSEFSNALAVGYRSKFLRDLCLSDEVSLFLSDIAGISLSPHTIPHQLGHINFNPLELEKNIDKWHVDTLTFDYVLFVTDPKKMMEVNFNILSINECILEFIFSLINI